MRILLVHNYYKVSGGEDTIVRNEKRLLENNGHETFLYSRSNKEIDDMGFLRKLLLPFTAVFSLKTYKEVRKLILQEKVDMVHVHNTLSLISPSVYYAALSCGIKVVQTVHNFRLICPNATLYRDGHICEDCLRSGLKKAVLHKCYRESRIQTIISVLVLKVHRLMGTYKKINYICLTDFNKEKLKTLGKNIDYKKMYVRGNYTEAKDLTLSYTERKNQYAYVGRLDKLKGINFLMQAWKDFEDNGRKLIVCGTGQEEAWAKTYAQKNGLDNILFMGQTESDKVRKIISESKGVILPTQCYEGFPMIIVESFAQGTPVLGSSIGNVGDIITEGITGVKGKIESPRDIIHLVERFEKMDGGYLSDKCLQQYSEKYTLECAYRELMNIYADCSAGGQVWK